MRDAIARTADPPTDEQLLAAFQRGHDAAFEELVHRHGAGIKAYAQRMLRSEEAAEEIYVETFSRIVRERDNLEIRGTTRGFLYTIAHRLCISRIRRRQTRRRFAPHLLALEGGRTKAPTSEDIAAAAELSQALERALERLGEEHRQVLMLRTMHGLSSRETAEITGLDESQVRSHLSYARKRLKVFLAELYQAPLVVRGEEVAR